MSVALQLKYASRHAIRRNPWVFRWCADLVSRERVDPALHRSRQEVLLADLLRASASVPAYARLAARAPKSRLLDYLRDAFPLIDKSTLISREDEFFSRGRRPTYSAVVAQTSGTTGTPLDVYRSPGSILREEAFHLQHWHWTGWRRGMPQAILRGDTVVPIGQRRPPFWFEDRFGKQLVLSTRHLDRGTASAFAQELRRFGPVLLRAYPSAAYDLATFVEDAELPVRFDAVITGSEMLYDFQRARIESAFRTKVYDFYGMAERVGFAAACEHGRLHVNPEYGIVEIVDEQGRPTDGEGNVVGTSLHNAVMPLIRYRMNDTARWSREPCPCGRTYPVIETVSGRLADQLYDLDGRAVNCTVIGFAFDGLHNIRKAQVVQCSADRWTIRIVPGANYTASDGQRVLDKLSKEVSARVAATIEVVGDIPKMPNGKFKWVVQNYRPDSPSPRDHATASRPRSPPPFSVAC
ncbi:MAG: phenylacetate--CoA ligase family protein [Steroidobacteraceae bacterium]|nr:phenylacetate--CoA ligase family protein [Steroidobacteraceae bacterium]